MRNISFWLGIAAIGLAFSSCKKEGCTDASASNYSEDAKKDDGSCVYAPTNDYTVPTTYTFERNGATSVSFSGQTDRMNMLGEMVTLAKTANTPGTSVDAGVLKNMYANENTPFTDADLNASSKQLKSKTAGGDAAIQAQFEMYMDKLATISALTTSGVYDGANGKAGVVQSGSKAYLFDVNGMEYVQAIEKGLMGACFYHQITNVYLGDDKMNVDNTTVEDGKNYTEMEHHWDEAFGYFTNSTNFPTDGKVYWAKYSDKRDAQLGSNAAILNAFIKGRAAIVNNDMTTRDAQRTIIRRELEKVTIATAIYYLEAAKGNIADDCLRNHELSEAVMFIEAIKYGYETSFTTSQVNDMLSKLGSNFYEVKTADIDAVVATLSANIQVVQ